MRKPKPPRRNMLSCLCWRSESGIATYRFTLICFDDIKLNVLAKVVVFVLGAGLQAQAKQRSPWLGVWLFNLVGSTPMAETVFVTHRHCVCVTVSLVRYIRKKIAWRQIPLLWKLMDRFKQCYWYKWQQKGFIHVKQIIFLMSSDMRTSPFCVCYEEAPQIYRLFLIDDFHCLQCCDRKKLLPALSLPVFHLWNFINSTGLVAVGQKTEELEFNTGSISKCS